MIILRELPDMIADVRYNVTSALMPLDLHVGIMTVKQAGRVTRLEYDAHEYASARRALARLHTADKRRGAATLVLDALDQLVKMINQGAPLQEVDARITGLIVLNVAMRAAQAEHEADASIPGNPRRHRRR